MRDRVLELLERVHSFWTAYLTSTSSCLASVLFLQQKINISDPDSSSIWTQFELLRFLSNFWSLYTEFSPRTFTFVVDIYILMVMKRKLNGICMRLSHVFRVLMIIMGTRSEKAIVKFFSVILFWHLSRNTTIPNEAGWTGLLVVKR